MRWGARVALCAILALLLPLFILKNHLEDLCDQYRAGAYVIDWLNLGSTRKGDIFPQRVEQGDKVIVMARLQEEHTDWVEQELPDWQRAIYVVNPSKAAAADSRQLTTPLNKGHESMAYLTYLIDNYDSLPATIAFLHSHRSGFLMAWHVDAPLHDNVLAMKDLQLDFVQQNGYVNLRCNWNPGCKQDHRTNRHVTEEVFTDIFEGTSTPPINSTGISTMQDQFELAQDQEFLRMPKRVAAACCAQFAVSREQVLKRPREDYLRIRQWIINTDKDDASSGRVMEFLWHVIFGKESIYCPDEEVCYCQVYRRC
ncbi:hypothetical protein BO94DRAFT_513606 [Aspergillus sclerotioniger CBS 115572]|uniref:Uncharacterized protein n=1 Tax=Aspergillus sclerotioniger CBS 115572 TaxID=1450535 RepID=A0A317X3B0_9EURO|nr:hypothetical protein BO94DRAFT_513606 [Aspergillus sclerotioniger CBS 115572]PWY91468.1 hypothetical protein BO94DRAFT_513606 [Aspergillus sclerotioniger CBS 115572]